MTIVSGYITTITGEPSNTLSVSVRADRTRPSTSGVTTAEPQIVSWHPATGELTFTAEPGAAVITLSMGTRMESIPISVPEKATATLEEVVSEKVTIPPPVVNLARQDLEELRVNALAQMAEVNGIPRIESLEAMNGVSPETPIDGQTANLLSQPDTLTRSAVSMVMRQDLVAVGPTVPPDFPQGKPVLWVDTSNPVEITSPVPELGASWADLPQGQGVEWRINGAPAAPGLRQVDPGMSMVSAHPEDGYVITGRSQWIDDFTDAKIIADDFSGAAGGSALTGRATPVGGAVWEAPRGALEGFSGSTGLFIADPPGNPARITMPVGGGGSHNVLDVGYADYRITFNAVIYPSNNATVGMSVRSAETGGDTGVQWRWRWQNTYGLRVFRRIDGVNVSFNTLPQPSVGLGWSGPVEITAHGDQITIRVVVGDVVFEDSVTYTENPGSTIIGIALAAHATGTNQPRITNLQVVPL